MLAITDDDCAPGAGWLATLAAALERHPTPAAVTGAVLPLGARPPGLHAISLRMDTRAVDYHGRMRPWIAGSGGNFAASSDLLRRHHGWDERLGPGSPGQSFEDAELLYRILREGGVVRYEPAAVVRHEWQTWATRLATRSSYGHGIGAMCGLWLRRGDVFALRLFAGYARAELHVGGGRGRRPSRKARNGTRTLAHAHGYAARPEVRTQLQGSLPPPAVPPASDLKPPSRVGNRYPGQSLRQVD